MPTLSKLSGRGERAADSAQRLQQAGADQAQSTYWPRSWRWSWQGLCLVGPAGVFASNQLEGIGVCLFFFFFHHPSQPSRLNSVVSLV